MFDLNFISDPGMQNNTSDESWSFLQKKNETDKSVESDSKQLKTTSIQKNSWKHYVFVLTILGLIAVISILNSRYTQEKPNLLVLNQVIDLIDECSYIKTLQLKEANFSRDQIKVTIRSENFTDIQTLSQDYRMGNEIPYEMYQKGKFSFVNLIFPWIGNEKGGDISVLESIREQIVFSNKTSIDHAEDIFALQGDAPDIISFLLQMAENNQIQKFNFSVFHQDSVKFNLKVKLHLL